MLSIILACILLVNVIWWRGADHLARQLRHALVWRLVIGLFMGGQIVLLFWVLMGGVPAMASAVGRPPQLLSAAAYLWHLLLLPACWAVVVTSALVSGTWRWGRRLAGRTPSPNARVAGAEVLRSPGAGPRDLALQRGLPKTPAPATPEVQTPTRRQVLGMLTAAAPAVLTGAGMAYTYRQLREFRVRPMAVALPSLPAELDGLRIALVADLHVGTFTNGQTVKRIIEETSRLDADLILLPGDLINYALSDLSDALDAVCNLQSRHGTYLCVGNHDLIEDGEEFIRRVKARAPLLFNESRVVPVRGRHVQLLGLPWSHDDPRIASSVRDLAGQIEPGAFPILLAHHPHAFDAAAAAGIPLTVSGHTHGGQLMLTDTIGFGPLMYRYWSGLYRQPAAALVVSNGVGNWLPLRTNAPAEIIHLTLRSAA